MKLDIIDFKIIKALLIDGRKPLAHIAKELDLPLATVHFHLKKMEKTGLIKGYEMYCNPSSAYKKLNVLLILIKALPDHKDEIINFIKTSSHFNKGKIFKFEPYTARITGNYNIVVYVYSNSSSSILLIKQLLSRHPAILDVKIGIQKMEYWFFEKVFLDQVSKMVEING